MPRSFDLIVGDRGHAVGVILFVAGLFILGVILDHRGETRGWPPRLPVRYEFLAVVIGVVTLVIALASQLAGCRRPPKAKPAR